MARPGLAPAVLLLLAAILAEALDLDRAIAHAWFYRADAHLWLGQGDGSWWARDLIHGGGRWLVRSVAAMALGCWALSFLFPPLRRWRQQALFVFLGIVLVTGIVGLLKQVTNVDCPWDLTGFGGDRPYVPLFGDRPDNLPAGRCFPGAHSSSGFALMALWFVLREHRLRIARYALFFAISLGALFSIGQQARGAHFLSHDLTSAALAWAVLRTLHARLLTSEESAPVSTPAFPMPGSRGCCATSTTTATPPAPR